MKYRSVIVGMAIAGAALATGCSSDDKPPDTPATPATPDSWVEGQIDAAKPFAPNEVGIGRNGAQVTINSVQDETTSYGPAAVFTFTINNTTAESIDSYLWTSPTLVQGTTPVDSITSGADKLGYGIQGVIPPGASQTVREGYEIPKSAITDAVLTEGSIVWQGDFSTLPDAP